MRNAFSVVRRVLSALAAVALLVATANSAQALKTPFTRDRLSGNLGLRLGTDELEVGLGARLGYTLDMNVYLGGTFDYFFGDDSADFGGWADADLAFWVLAMEGGYDFGITPELVLRPLIGFGVTTTTWSACALGMCIDDSDSDPELILGGQLLYAIDQVTLGVDVRVLVADAEALVLGLNLGAVF